MTNQTEPTFLFVPGLRDHVADHWQTLLADRLPKAVTVPPLTEDKLSCTARVAALEEALAQIDGDVVMVAHSAGVIMVVHWALQSSRRIRGALLAAPPDLEHPLPAGYPALKDLVAGGWTPIPRRPLPFPSTVVASDNDPLAALDRVEGFARDWGSELLNAGKVGHLNPAAGYGDWPLAGQLIRRF